MRPAQFTADQLAAMNSASTASNDKQNMIEQLAGNQQQIEQSAEEQVAQQEQPAQEEQKPAIPTDEKGNMLYHQVPVETTINDLYDGKLDDNEIRDFVDVNISEADKNLEKVSKKAPKIGTNKDEYLKKKQEWQKQVEDATRIRDYWNGVKDYIAQQTHTTPEEVKAAQDELSGEAARREYQDMGENIQQDPISVANDTTGEEQADDRGNQVLSEQQVTEQRGSEGGTEPGTEVQAGVQGTDENAVAPEEASGERIPNIERGSQGYTGYIARRQQNNLETSEEINVPLSQNEQDEYGNPMVLAENGSTVFGTIESESGLTEAPIKLSLGENKVGTDGKNHGYGLLHIEAGHGEQIRNAGYQSVEQFVENVAQNYTDIKEGALIGKKQTYLLEVSDEHNNTLFIQLSNDGTYWNVNSAGIFKKKYSRRKPLIYTVPAVGKSTVTDTSEVNSGQSMGATAPAGNSSESKDSDKSAVAQTIDEKIAKAEEETDVNPTEGQKEAGNYKKGHVRIDGYDITIEQPKGSVRRGTDADGKQWEQTMNNTYGYIRGTEGVDGDHIDIFLSDNPTEGNVYVVDQVNADGSFDEHKVMYGFQSAEDARAAYLSNYEEGWQGLGTITEVSKEEFKKWVNSSRRKTKPFAEYKSVKADGSNESNASKEDGGGVRLRLGENGAKPLSAEETAIRDAVVGRLRESGFEVITDTEEGQRVLDEANGRNVRLNARKKRALETASVSLNETSSTAISSADGANIVKKLDALALKYENRDVKQTKTFIGEVADALEIKADEKSSKYATFEAKNGKRVTIRLSNHNATVSNFDNNGEVDGISIVVTPANNNGILNDGNAHIIEYYYNAMKLRRAEDKPLADIVKSIKQALYSGEYKDTTGLAEVEEVNGETIREQRNVRFFRTPNGEAYGFTVGGKIYIDPRVATADTPIHEYAHLWASALRQGNPEEWQNVVGLMKGTPVWDEVRRRYPELTADDDIADEVLATYSGRRGAERLKAETRKAVDGKGVFEAAQAVTAMERVKEALRKFWKGVADFLHIHYTSAEEVADRVMSDLLEGRPLPKSTQGKDDIRYRFIGEQGAANLDAAEEATTRLDNLSVAREMEYAYNEKKARIEKLKDSKPVDVKYNGEYDLNRKPAKDWLKENVRGEYTNNDTGEKIGISKVGINEVTSHGSKDKAHLKSLIAIPQMIEQSIFIDEIPNTKGHDKYDSYKYYVCGLKIDNVDYIVKLVVGVKGDNKYYDHRLTEIEKGTLIDNLNGLSNSVAENQNANISYGKDTKLQSILQTNDRENARKIKLATGWERGADGKWRYETPDFEYYPNGDARKNDKYKETDWYNELHGLEEKLFNGETLTDEETKRFDELSARVNDIRDNDKNMEHVYLDDYIRDDELFKAYPELKLTRIDFVDIPNARYSAKYNEEENRITLNLAKSIDDKSAIAHELQHAIQRIEGFARGSNVDNYRNAHTSENVILDIIHATDGRLLDEEGFDNTPEGIFNALNRKTTYGTILRDYSSELDDIANKYGYETIFDLVNDIDKFKSSVEMYLSEAGEVEARNVEARINMTSEERRQSLASETEDVARELTKLGVKLRESNDVVSEGANTNEGTNDLYREADTEEEINSIIDKAKADGTYMKAPNGNPTNLNERQWAQVRTKAFKDWFGDWENDPENASKVVDENGEPKVVYHGTRSEFNAFAPNKVGGNLDYGTAGFGFYFTESLQNAENISRNAEGLNEPKVLEVFLNIRKPNERIRMFETDGSEKKARKLTERSMLKGYDGANPSGIGLQWWVAYFPNQIKSATDNTGAFSPEDDDIRRRQGTGALTDSELSNANDPAGKMLGKPSRTPAQQKAFAERERQRMADRAREVADILHLDNVEIVTDASTLQGRRAKASILVMTAR